MAPPLVAQDELDVDTEIEGPAVLEPIEVWVVREKSQARRAETFALFTQDMMRRSEEISPYEFFKMVCAIARARVPANVVQPEQDLEQFVSSLDAVDGRFVPLF